MACVNVEKSKYPYALILIILLFFIWGGISAMNDVLVAYFKELFILTELQSLLIQFAFFGAYGFGALSYYLYSNKFGDPINKVGYKQGIMSGLIIAGIGCISFYPTILSNNYYVILGSFFIIGIGLTLIQISCNPYVAIIGKPQSASARLNLAQGFNSLGTTLGPLLGGFLVFNYLSGNAAIQVPYLICGAILFLFAFLLYKVDLPDYKNQLSTNLKGNALQFSHLKKGMLAIFFYVGAEVAISSKLLEYAMLPTIGNVNKSMATDYLALYWGGAMIGRLLIASIADEIDMQKTLAQKIRNGVLTIFSTFIILFLFIGLKSHVLANDESLTIGIFVSIFKFTSPLLIFVTIQFILMLIFSKSSQKLLASFSFICVALLLTSYIFEGNIGLWSVIAIGLFNSIMWSNIFTLSIAELKDYTSQGSSLLIIMIVGGAILPLGFGLMADWIDLPTAFLFPIISYLYILYFGRIGYKIKQTKIYE